MGRPPCCDKLDVRRGLWTAEEDAKLLAHISNHGTKNWTSVPQKAGLKRCGKSCRLRWTNYLRPNLKHESFTPEEEELIVTLHATIGSRWSIIAQQLPGRTDNDVKNYWNTKLSKKLFQRGIDPITHRPVTELLRSIGGLQTVRYRAPHDARISSLNRDLRSVFRYNDHIGAAAPNGSDKETAPPLQPHLLPDEASWSTTAAGAAPNPTLIPSAAPSPPPADIKWSDFLVEDAFLPHDQVDDAAGSNPTWKPADGEHKAAEEEGGIGSMGVPSCSSSSFIDEILDRDRTMMSDFWCKFEVFKID